jgi:hypothetical protein
MEVSERELVGRKRYICDVDMKGHPYGPWANYVAYLPLRTIQ